MGVGALALRGSIYRLNLGITQESVPINIHMRINQLSTEAIQLSPRSHKAQAWIDRVYAEFPQTWQHNHVMMLGGEGDDAEFAMFELVPSLSKRDAVEVKWFQAYPLRQGVGSRAMRVLQDMAQQDGIALTLYPWDKGQVSQAKLTKFYKNAGFKPTAKGAKTMAWEPSMDEGKISPADMARMSNTVMAGKQPPEMPAFRTSIPIKIHGYPVQFSQHFWDRWEQADPERIPEDKKEAVWKIIYFMLNEAFSQHTDEIKQIPLDQPFAIKKKTSSNLGYAGLGMVKANDKDSLYKTVWRVVTYHPNLRFGRYQNVISVWESQMVKEGLTHKDPVERWITVFKASTHPKFAGKTAEQRERMARMAQYRAVQNKKTFENMDHSKDSQAVPELRAALLARKKQIKRKADDKDAVYDIINGLMSSVAKSHGISGQKMHDLWVDKYGEIPDTWILHESALPGSRTPTEAVLAKQYTVGVAEIKRQLKKGIKVELEHTTDRAVAREIALDHLGENLYYYDQLKRAGLEEAWLDMNEYGGWITPNRKVEYVEDQGHEAHLRREHGLRQRQAFLDGYVRFQTNAHTSTFSIEGQLSALRKTYRIWGQTALNARNVYIDIFQWHDDMATQGLTPHMMFRPSEGDKPQIIHSFGTKVAEAFDKPYELPKRWKHDSDDAHWKVIKLPDSRELKIQIDYEPDYKIAIWNFWVDDNQKITGKGDAFRVFATAIAALRQFVQSKKPDIVAFMGDDGDPSRIKMYDRLVPWLISQGGLASYDDITDEPDMWPDMLSNFWDERYSMLGKVYVLASNDYMYNDEEFESMLPAGQNLSEAKKRRAKTIIDGMIKSLIKQGRTRDEAIADLKRQVDSRFYEHIDAVANMLTEDDDASKVARDQLVANVTQSFADKHPWDAIEWMEDADVTVDSDPQLKAVFDANIHQVADMFVQELRQSGDFGVLNMMAGMIDQIGITMPDPRIARILEGKRDLIDRIIGKNLSFAGISEVLETIMALEGWGIDHYYMEDFIDLEDGKDDVIRSLLKLIKSNRRAEVRGIIQRLRDEGWDWPEFAAFDKSINAQGTVKESHKDKAKIKLYTDPKYFGAEVDDSAGDGKPVVNIQLADLVGFEPDEKMKDAKSAANMSKMVKLIKAGKGDELPPILARRYKGGYQVLDGHHRFHAYQAAGAKTIPAKVIPADEIEVIDKAPVNEAKKRLDRKCWTGYKKQGTKLKNGVRVNNCVPKESADGKIAETRQGAWQWLKDKLPRWPDYVLRDWLYQSLKGDAVAGAAPQGHIDQMLDREGLGPDTVWKLVPNFEFTMGILNPWTVDKLHRRWAGKSDAGIGVTNDAARHATQHALIKQQGGISKEPVILVKKPDGYELEEGWHRTIQHFALYPNGYNGPAWVAVSTNINEHFADGNLSYQGNCTEDDIIDSIFGDVNEFARLVDEYGDEFEINDLVVKYDPDKDIHSFYYKMNENFADGKGPGRPGDSRRHGIPKHATMSELEKASHAKGRKGQLARWQLNMRRGRAKAHESEDMTADQWQDLRKADPKSYLGMKDYRNRKWWESHFKAEMAKARVSGKSHFEFPPGTKMYYMVTKNPLEEGKSPPHGSPEHELAMMKAGTKPAVTFLDMGQYEELYEPNMEHYDWIKQKWRLPNMDVNYYVIGQPGQEARIKRIGQLIYDMNKAGSNPTADYHRELGRLLGYSEADVDNFLKDLEKDH